MTEVKISESKYREMMRDIAKLNALEAGGVDNWDYYDDALKDWCAENEVDELVDALIEDINDILVDADIEQPAGAGAGYAVHMDESALAKRIRTRMDEYIRIKTGKTP